ncbi:alpha-glucosidase-like isoform X2 [Ceratina calcarata]|uniref:alpha-glucosidase n=1 Tax=Ceratina calcarata TaxID=156304 RepID=A0AAJ7S751_9HYME|nr:alpha-glucosidase-like isoform X1 [Ceratina calcarata]XP_026672581.1 alpha-glucosidase-like isoform X1 [Ceratina calcarata]XP_026672582.1 alpha-glucosidase-like isoform X2 [Ceratina calcarata]XP_026672583.1 alpha-glucosidase-like isoform X2 [Ceratina calcarata]XP_026672584.1 alpha-glucosidase-like isoform X2 [Ceratina calcarata]
MRAMILFSVITCSMVSAEIAGKSKKYSNRDLSLYQVYPLSFKDSDGNGIGDLRGIIENMDHFIEAKVDAIWISPVYRSPMIDFGYDISNFTDIDPSFGTMEDFEILVKTAHAKDLKVIVDFVPNHTSTKHPWFLKSLQGIEPYKDYYVWHEGKVLENGTRVPPNNWMSVVSGGAWEWRDERQAYYLHQLLVQEADLNYYNENVVNEIKDILRFWLKHDVDGIRVDSVMFLCEDLQLRDEPRSYQTDDPTDKNYLAHIYTNNLPETYRIVQGWRDVMNEFGKDMLMMTEAYTDLNHTIYYYKYGADPFNFGFITDVNKDSKAADFKKVVDTWISNMPTGHTPNWVGGNHDKNRMTARLGPKRARAITMMTLLLPGIGVTYYGDEIGMTDAYISWEENQSEQGCLAGPENYLSHSSDPERTPFQWDNSTAAGFSTNPKTWIKVNKNYKTLNLAAEKKDENSVWKMYEKLATLKRSPNFKKTKLNTKLLSDNVFAFSREHKKYGSVYAVINFSEQEDIVDLSAFNNVPKKLYTYYATDGITSLPKTIIKEIKKVKVPASGFLVLISSDSEFGVL